MNHLECNRNNGNLQCDVNLVRFVVPVLIKSATNIIKNVLKVMKNYENEIIKSINCVYQVIFEKSNVNCKFR